MTETPPSSPFADGIYVNVELTDHCNLRCKMCSQSLKEQAHGRPESFIDWEGWRAAIRGLADMPGPVHLCPHWLGEPTTHPDFEQLVEYAFAVNRDNRYFATFKLHTNGVLLDRRRAARLLRLATRRDLGPGTFRTVYFSLDAWSREVYREVKGADLRDRVYENVEGFLRLRAELGQWWPAVHLGFVVQPENAHEARAFVEHWGRLLDRLGREMERSWTLSADWPGDGDAIYLRRLNAGEQEAADALHARVVAEFGLGPDRLHLSREDRLLGRYASHLNEQRVRAWESF